MITRIVKMTFREDEVPTFRRHFEEHHQLIRNFAGCEKLMLWQDINDSCVFFTYSWWQDKADLEAYRQSDLFKSVWAKTKVLFKARPEAWSVESLIEV